MAKNNEALAAFGLRDKRRFRRDFQGNGELLLLTVPAVAYFILFHYVPMFGVILAFKDYSYQKGILGSAWIGLKNFDFFFLSQDAWRITRNTVCYSAVFIVTGIVFGIIIALLLFEIRSKIAIKAYQTLMILPHFISWVIVGYITYIFFNPALGVLNQLLAALQIEPVQWYLEARYWPFIILTVNTWKNIGMGCIVYYAALLGIDESLYEAAIVDGASRWKQTWYISIPSLVPLMTILSILSIGNMFRGDFGLFYQIPRDVGTLYPTTDIIDTYVYRGLRNGDIGISSAVGLFQSVMGLVLVTLANRAVKKLNPENALY